MRHWVLGAWAICMASAVAGQSETADLPAPMSAINWLSQSVTRPAAALETRMQETGTRAPVVPHNEAPVADSAATPTITMTPLDAPSPDPIGLLPPDVTGLPRNLWAHSENDTVVALLQASQTNSLPALQDFFVTLMLAEADPPLGAGTDGTLFLARVDKLLEFGAIEEARALLEQADLESPALFRRWFDTALLTGSEDGACDVMQSNPRLAPTFSARIFCLARSGDWNTAALTLNTHRVLGDMSDEQEELLTRFLDPELFEDDANLPMPSRISPLVFRMREAIGEGLPTQNLPRAFAHADLRGTVGWKSQIEAAERLARSGAVDDTVLLGFYTARPQSASGGVWDRVAAMQRFDIAMRARDPFAVAAALPEAWAAAKTARIEPVFARLYAAILADLPLPGSAAPLAIEIGLLSNDYEAFALDAPIGFDPFARAVARGFAEDAVASGPVQAAIKAGFTGAEFAPVGPAIVNQNAGLGTELDSANRAVLDEALPAAIADLLRRDKLGEALLRNVALFHAGLSGDLRALTQSIAVFRAVGLEDVARRAALQFILLERHS